MRGSPSDFPVKTVAQSNIDPWFQAILTAQSSPADSSRSTPTTRSISDRSTPVQTYLLPEDKRSSPWIWEYIHRVCATGKLEL
ncbi:hypothetical protein N7451_012335 [Penicillium sp. IBT 35674x]|nr:hypothetical protein N7451_012254 [Penicillium sp. IBT 35674x]KAJ5982235.1 hypothetical protein N7451_012335 [Penicillium sp. IBT 35674x]